MLLLQHSENLVVLELFRSDGQPGRKYFIEEITENQLKIYNGDTLIKLR